MKAWVWLCLLLMTAVVVTTTLSFVGLHWLWPIGFFVSSIVALHRYGTLLVEEREKVE